MELSDVLTFETVTAGSDDASMGWVGCTEARCLSSVVPVLASETRCQSAGPEAAGTAAHWSWCWKYDVPSSSHESRVLSAPVATTGWVVRGCTRELPATSYT